MEDNSKPLLLILCIIIAIILAVCPIPAPPREINEPVQKPIIVDNCMHIKEAYHNQLLRIAREYDNCIYDVNCPLYKEFQKQTEEVNKKYTLLIKECQEKQ